MILALLASGLFFFMESKAASQLYDATLGKLYTLGMLIAVLLFPPMVGGAWLASLVLAVLSWIRGEQPRWAAGCAIGLSLASLALVIVKIL